MNQSKTIIHPLAIVDILKEFQDIKKKKFSGKKIGSLLGYYKKKKKILLHLLLEYLLSKKWKKIGFWIKYLWKRWQLCLRRLIPEKKSSGGTL
mmetsp:Transcript_37859/g.88089  ORF Transcript_37859/g.88089 Transcript_37859/m.88089 type:complete len:93 (-) Transcript_37859:369-647(-)